MIQRACPIIWKSEDSLFSDWSKHPVDKKLVHNCMEYVNPEKKGRLMSRTGETLGMDMKGAQQALCRDGTIPNIYKFETEAEDDFKGEDYDDLFWKVSQKARKGISKDEASSMLEELLRRDMCEYPKDYIDLMAEDKDDDEQKNCSPAKLCCNWLQKRKTAGVEDEDTILHGCFPV